MFALLCLELQSARITFINISTVLPFSDAPQAFLEFYLQLLHTFEEEKGTATFMVRLAFFLFFRRRFPQMLSVSKREGLGVYTDSFATVTYRRSLITYLHLMDPK